ncbi:hypothetical protein H6P81_006046 [Aristolochia fimbriata]|uniref:RanBD1 domain-containing protein n=1 Tax=Aristolochia fimbriata TaxID=158543 RepID=A0AAV7EWD5_ARIFI|nr:hypothetical protein H6P81_006046 [Aristolochia fimbriata]
MSAPLFGCARVESSGMGPPQLDVRRAESAHLHVTALNSQFASWVQSQLQNHPDELWLDGVRDYLSHASQIMEKFRDVVDWLKVNAEKAETVAATSMEKIVVSAANTSDMSFPAKNGKSGYPTFGSASSGATIPWSFGLVPNNQTPILPRTPSYLLEKQDAVEDAEGDDDVQQPSSPSLKKSVEKGAVVVHEAKCKVYIKPDNPTDKGWKDMGVGQLSIKCKEGASKDDKESKPTIVVHNDVGKVLLNAFIYPGIKMNVQKNTLITILHTLGIGSLNGDEAGQDAVAKARTYLLKLKTEEDTNKLAQAIREYEPAS